MPLTPRPAAEGCELHVEGIKAGPAQAAAATAWKQADVDQARHPREAVQGGRKGKSPRTRVPASTPDRQIGRDGRYRLPAQRLRVRG